MFWWNAFILGEIVKWLPSVDNVMMLARVNKCAREVCLEMRGNEIAQLKQAVEMNDTFTCGLLGSLRGIHKLRLHEDWDWALRGACEGGHKELVELMIEKGATRWDWGLRGACRGGHKDLAELMIEKGATNWNSAFRGACRGGHKELVELMIEKGATDWDGALFGAHQGGHTELFEFIMKKRATR